MAKYLYNLGSQGPIRLGARNYRDLAALVGVTGADPGVTLRRHHLLAMEMPLNLLVRTDGRSWDEINLTPLGVDLATANDSNAIMERALGEIVFCRGPYYTATRQQEYQDFEIRPYRATLQVLQRTHGWIDRDEYDLFLSRIRNDEEIAWAVDGILEFRNVNDAQRQQLLHEVQVRVPGEKSYQNWRDMGLHTFSLFSLGISAIRAEQILRLTRTAVEPVTRVPRPAAVVRPVRAQRGIALRVPQPPANAALNAPPLPRDPNGGAEGELLVAKLLEAAGWRVVFYTNRRGFGFDLWAKNGEAVMLVEVKSSLARLGSISLTRVEHAAAQQYGNNFYLAAVENLAGTPTVQFIQNPAGLTIQEQHTTEYNIRRDVWERAANALEG
ncbi:MAG TPA: DUF3883 domain-containing protein [Clostridia bacterium]|nr:DUF3883 domain-containing protein [Clostridia bacterium]